MIKGGGWIFKKKFLCSGFGAQKSRLIPRRKKNIPDHTPADTAKCTCMKKMQQQNFPALTKIHTPQSFNGHSLIRQLR